MPKILLAIEDPISADLLDDRLERRGLRTARVSNGVDVLRRVRDESFDIVLADTRLSGRTGFELLQDFRDPTVVLLGKQDNDAEEVRAFKLGAAEYLTLPFNPEIAVARILRLLPSDFPRGKQNTEKEATGPVQQP